MTKTSGPTEAEIDWAARVLRAAHAGTRTMQGRTLTAADVRKAGRILAAFEASPEHSTNRGQR